MEIRKEKIQRKSHAKVRTGCHTCRKRGYKCDEERPSCHNCVNLNIACEGYGIRLKWASDMVSRGLCHGRSRKAPRRAESNQVVLCTSGNTALACRSPISAPSMLPSSVAEDYHLIQHFFHNLSRLLCTSQDHNVNFCRTAILPLALSSDVVKFAVLSASASHLSFKYDHFDKAAVMRKSVALKAINQSINQLTNHTDSSPNVYKLKEYEILAAAIMLMIQGVIEGSRMDWSKHIEGGGALLYKLILSDTFGGYEVLKDVWAYHDILMSVGSCRAPQLLEFYPTWKSNKATASVLFPTINSLLSLVAQISDLSSRSRDVSWEVQKMIIFSALSIWEPPKNASVDMTHTAKAMHQAAIIYFLKAVDDVKPGDFRLTRPLKAGLNAIQQISTDSPTVASHLWPLLTFGAECHDLEDREWIHTRLLEMTRTRGMVSSVRGLEYLERIWKSGDTTRIFNTSLVLL